MIGIYNLQNVDNYGCVLGAYALLHVICGLSVAPAELIDYRPELRSRTFVQKTVRLLERCRIIGVPGTMRIVMRTLGARRIVQGSPAGLRRKERFESFRETYLKRSPVYIRINSIMRPVYDTYVVGSDVVWLLEDVWAKDSPAFLAYTRDIACRRVSYAASLGDFSEQIGRRKIVKRLYQEGLKRFDMVSVREETSAAYLAPLYSGKIYCCMDPTLLLGAKDYDLLISNRSKHAEGKYIYVYMLDDTGDFYKTANEISKQMDMPIVRCCHQVNGYNPVAVEAEEDGPLDFLERIKNAELVISNSFHAVCFSLIYHKNFFVVRRTTQAYKTEELLKRIGLTDRYLDVSNGVQALEQPIDFTSVDQKLEAWRKESIDYLTEALSDGREKI